MSSPTIRRQYKRNVCRNYESDLVLYKYPVLMTQTDLLSLCYNACILIILNKVTRSIVFRTQQLFQHDTAE